MFSLVLAAFLRVVVRLRLLAAGKGRLGVLRAGRDGVCANDEFLECDCDDVRSLASSSSGGGLISCKRAAASSGWTEGDFRARVVMVVEVEVDHITPAIPVTCPRKERLHPDS